MVDQRVMEWRAKFKKLQGGKEIVSLEGETNADLARGDVNVCTPTQVRQIFPFYSQFFFSLVNSGIEIKTHIVACGVSLANARDDLGGWVHLLRRS